MHLFDLLADDGLACRFPLLWGAVNLRSTMSFEEGDHWSMAVLDRGF
jgi:hypothetical protein